MPVIILVEEIESQGSRVISLDYERFLSGHYFHPYRVLREKPLFVLPWKSSNGRIHQLQSFDKGKVLCAASEDNSIVIIDLQGGPLQTVYPFKDQFGAPIKSGDHNHINSICYADNLIYFLAYKAGDKSMIGCLGEDGLVHGFFMQPRGYHDIYPHKNGFLTCDTFGREEYGRIISESGCWMSKYLEENAIAPRGVARDGSEWVFGYSHKGPRQKRFSGNGGLITTQDGVNPELTISLPSSQVYQIVPLKIEGDAHLKCQVNLYYHLEKVFGQATMLGQFEKISG